MSGILRSTSRRRTDRYFLPDGPRQPVDPAHDDPWLPGLVAPVPDHPHFPKLVEAIRMMREREAWVPDRGPGAPMPVPHLAPAPDLELRLPPLLILMAGMVIGAMMMLPFALSSEHRVDAVARANATPAGGPHRHAEPAESPNGLEILGATQVEAAEPIETDEVSAAGDATEGEPATSGLPSNGTPAPEHGADGAGDDGVDAALGRAFYELAHRQQAAGDAEAALDSFKRSAMRSPDQAATFYDWGWVLQQEGDVAGAFDKYRATVDLEPKHAFARYNMGYMLQSAGDLVGARRTYEAALAADAANTWTLYNLGWLEQRAGEDEAAMEHYQAALDQDPDHALSHYNLANLYEKLGERQSAILQYRRALSSDPDLSRAEERLEALGAARGG